MKITTITIKLKKVIAFILVLFAVSFIWLGFQGWSQYKQIFADKNTDMTAENSEQDVSEPVVAITLEQENGSKDNFFSEYRIDRERTRSEQVEILREIVNNPNSSSQTRQEAQRKLIAISDNLEKESRIEKMLIAKGFKEAIADIQADGAMVIVPSAEIREEEAAKISDIVIKVVGCSIEDVTIVPKAP